MKFPTPSKDELKQIKNLRALLLVARGTFLHAERDECLDFPSELHQLRDLIQDLYRLTGVKTKIRIPFWKHVLALDEALPDLNLVKTLTELFERPAEIQAGPMIEHQLIRDSCDLAEKRAIDLLDHMIDPILRDIDGRVTEVRKKPVSPQNLRDCAALFRKRKNPDLKRLYESSRKLGPEGADFFNYAAFWQIAFESLQWRTRYLPALTELIKLGLALEHPPLFDGLRQVIQVGFLDVGGVDKLQLELKRLRTLERVRKHQARKKLIKKRKQ